MRDLSVVIPIHHEDPTTVENLYNGLKELGCQVIIVDDGDTTHLKVPKLTYPDHRGYGAAIKAGVRAAETPVICTMDGDGEHDINDVFKLYTVFNMIENCGMVVGCRWQKKESPLRWIGRKMINSFATLWCRHLLLDLNSGMRVFRRDLALGYEPILCDTFSFTTSLTMALVTDNHKFAWFPINSGKRAFGRSKVRLIQDGLVTLWFIIWIGFALRTRGIRSWLRKLSGGQSMSNQTGVEEPTQPTVSQKDYPSFSNYSGLTKSTDYFS